MAKEYGKNQKTPMPTHTKASMQMTKSVAKALLNGLVATFTKAAISMISAMDMVK